MQQDLVKTNVLLHAVGLVFFLGLLYFLLTKTSVLRGEDAGGLFALIIIPIAIFGHALGKAKRLVLLGDRVEVRSFWPWSRPVSMQLNDLMHVKVRSFGPVSSFSLAASVSGDETKTAEEMQQATKELLERVQSQQQASQGSSFKLAKQAPNHNDAFTEFRKKMGTLMVRESVGWVSGADAQAAESMLKPYVENNMREANQKKGATESVTVAG